MEQDQKPGPLAAASVRKRQRMSRISEQRWNRLQREFRQAVLAEYPNPGRKDCPGTEAMRDLAERVVLREDLQKDQRWKHAMQCGPCFEEYIVLRDTCLKASQTDSLLQCG
jgi:hypothetical protein